MAIVRGKTYVCSYCKTPYNDQYKADRCRDGHDLIYVPLSKSDLNRLINFLYVKDEALLSKTLIDTLLVYVKGNHKEEQPRNYEDELDNK